MKAFLFSLVLFCSGNVSSQNTYTIFTDSIKLIKDVDTLLWKEHPQAFFINNTRDTTIQLYRDSNITITQHFSFPKLKKVTIYNENDVSLGKVQYGTYPSTSTYLTINDSRRLYGRGNTEMNMVDDYTDSITQQWCRYEDEYDENCNYFIELTYTTIKGGPLDISSYSSTKREGKWAFVSLLRQYVVANFENNIQSGLEITYQKNKLKIENYYEDGVITDVKVYDLKLRRYLPKSL